MIKQAVIEDCKTVAELAMLLWPEHEITELEEEMKDYISKWAIFICYNESVTVEFAQ